MMLRPRSLKSLGWRTGLALASLIISAWAEAQPADPADALLDDPFLQAQRERFRSALPRARAGARDAVDAVADDYALKPYLEAAWLGADLDARSPEQINAFLHRYGDALPARRLRYRWLLQLAKAERWEDYLSAWPGVSRPDTTLHCHQLTALLRTGKGSPAQLEDAGRTLWLVGSSQPEACDPLFRWLIA
ncbi:MAG: hypothetical protein AAFX85_08180, partial [Pseudomonadota bacterium]